MRGVLVTAAAWLIALPVAAQTGEATATPTPAETPAPAEATPPADAPAGDDVPADEPAPEPAPADPTEAPPAIAAEDPAPPPDEDSGFDPGYGKLPKTGSARVLPSPFSGDLNSLQSEKLPLGNFMDTRIAFSFSDDNFLAGPGVTTPSSPSVDFSPRSNNQLFFDNLNTRNTGYETLSSLVLHRRQRGFIPGMDTEAAIVSRFTWTADDDTGRNRASFFDDGSYLRIRYFFNQSVEDESAANIDLVMFPFNSNRFRLGYLWDISWGGNDIFPSDNGAVPGAKLQLNILDGYVYAGAKTARLQTQVQGTATIREIESFWGWLMGAGYDFFDLLQFDVGGGFFARGTNQNEGVQDQILWGGGGSARVIFHLGRAVPRSIDFRLYNSDPAFANLFQTAARPQSGFRFLATAEASHLEQTLQDPENLQSTKFQGWGGNQLLGGANAAALSAQFGWGDWDIRADGIYRDLAFITYSRPGLTPYLGLPAASAQSPEFLFALQTSYFIEFLHLTPAIVAGVQMPASYTGFDPSRLPADTGDGIEGAVGQSEVIRGNGSEDLLPCLEYGTADDGSRICQNASVAEPIYALRTSLKWDLSRMLSVIASVAFLVDNNENILINSSAGQTRERYGNIGFLPPILLPGTTQPHNLRIGGGIFAQARF